MVGFLTYGNRKFYELDGQIRKVIPPMYKAMKDLTQFIDADAAAFSEYMVSLRISCRIILMTQLHIYEISTTKYFRTLIALLLLAYTEMHRVNK